MSISYIKDVQVVFMVKEGAEAPREATEEDFLRAGYLPAAGRGHVSAPEVSSEKEAPAKDENTDEKDSDLTSCEDCVLYGEDHFRVEFGAFPELIGETIGDMFKDTVKVLRLNDLKDDLKKDIFDPLLSFADSKISEAKEKVEAEKKPAPKDSASPVEDFAGDLFNGAFNVFNAVKGGLSGLLDPLLDPITLPEAAKPAEKVSEPVKPVVEEPAAEVKPEFSKLEQAVIDQFEEMGLGADAKSAMRKSKEFSDFLGTAKPTAAQAKMFADLLKNGKPPFFG